jgi:hypothetical protein
MKIRLADKALAYLTLLCGLTISAVAIWYSVAGLVAIFAAAVIPIIVMGTTLEVSKLIATLWLKWNWHRAPFLIKTYLLTAIFVLMLITSMGIFGFLSKAHLDQALPTGEVSAQVALIDEKINNERETIANARTLLGQLDKAVTDISAAPDREVNGRTISSAERALQVRRQQAKDRASLTKTIEEAQARIVKLQEEKAPVASQLRAVEAEVGPIKYIAALIYGDDPENNLLEKAVRWVIIVIVLVFDPLAIVLLLASQTSFQWFRQEDDEKAEGDSLTTESRDDIVEPATVTEQPAANDDVIEKEPEPWYEYREGWPFPVTKGEQSIISGDVTAPEHFGLTPKTETVKDTVEEANDIVAETTVTEVDVDKILDTVDEIDEKHEQEIIEQATLSEREAMSKWKAEHPENSLKYQRKLLDLNLIDHLPWEDYMKAQPDYVDPDAEEAAKWAEEQRLIKLAEEEAKKKV